MKAENQENIDIQKLSEEEAQRVMDLFLELVVSSETEDMASSHKVEKSIN